MELSISEKIKVLLIKRDMSATKLAFAIGTTRQNLSNKLSRNNFTVKDLEEIAKALNCSFETGFVLNETGEKI